MMIVRFIFFEKMVMVYQSLPLVFTLETQYNQKLIKISKVSKSKPKISINEMVMNTCGCYN